METIYEMVYLHTKHPVIVLKLQILESAIFEVENT